MNTERDICTRVINGNRQENSYAAAIFDRLNAEIVGSNPTGVMDFCLLWVSYVVR